MKRRRAVALSLLGVGVLGLVALVGLRETRQGEGESGAGFTYQGKFYSQSGAEIRPDRLGRLLDRDVPIRDTATDVRAITGIDPGTAVAAEIRDWGGTPSEGGVAWLLMSPDENLAADPWSDEGVATAVQAP